MESRGRLFPAAPLHRIGEESLEGLKIMHASIMTKGDANNLRRVVLGDPDAWVRLVVFHAR